MPSLNFPFFKKVIFCLLCLIFSRKRPTSTTTSDVLLEVFQFLDGTSLSQSQFVCHDWYQVIFHSQPHIPAQLPLVHFYPHSILINGFDKNLISFEDLKSMSKKIYTPEQAVDYFWNHRTILKKVVVYANEKVYHTLWQLTNILRARLENHQKVTIKKFRIICDMENDYLHLRYTYDWMDMIVAENYSKQDYHYLMAYNNDMGVRMIPTDIRMGPYSRTAFAVGSIVK